MNYELYIIITAAVFAVAWLIQIIYQILINHAVLRRCKAEKKQSKVNFIEEKPGVSVVVYTHNQSEALLRNLPNLLDNDYPNFEVIVVDDMSTDETEDVMTLMEQRSDHLFHTKLTDKVRAMSHRKLALLLGVKAAHYDIVLMTQAQCVPATKNWIASMARNFTPETDIVLGPVVFERRKSFIARFYQYDLFQRMMFMFGTALSFSATAGWGTNMAIRKQIVFADNNRAFSSQLFIHPGEDDLLVKAMAKKENVAVECTPDAMIIDQETPLKTAWSKDRLNRAFTGKRYTFGAKLLKATDIFTRYTCVLTGILLAVYAGLTMDWTPLAIIVTMLVLRIILITTIYYQTSKSLGIHRYVFSPIVYDLYIPLVDLWFWIRASIYNRGFYVSHL